MKHALGVVLMSGIAAVPTMARAQPSVIPLPRNDVVISIGWFGGDYLDRDTYDLGWKPSVHLGLGGGHYWTDNLKTEVEAVWISPVETTSYEQVPIGGGFSYGRTAYRFQSSKLSFSQTYQFGRNAWVHPFLAAGVDVDYLRSVEDRPIQLATTVVNNRTGIPVQIPALHETESTIQARPFVKGGFKMYASDRLFFTTEWKLGLGDGVQNALWKTGIGVDF
jgi:hypothetical protein